MAEPLERFSALLELADLFRKRLERDEDARVALEEAKVPKLDSLAVPVQLLEA